jgi:hypothetical protein
MAWLDRIWPWFCLATAAWVAGRWISDSGQGFEFLDEGLYFLAAHDPWRNIHSTHFGFALHPLYELAGRDPGVYRILALLPLLAAARVTAGLLWQRQTPPWNDRAVAWSVGALILSGALLVFSDGRRTPAYDYLVHLGALLGWAGFLWADATQGRRWEAWVLLALGIQIAAFGKWVVAAVLVGLFACLFWIRKVSVSGGLLPLTVALGAGLAGAFFWIGPEALFLLWQEAGFIVRELGSHGTHLLPYYGLTMVNFCYRALRAFAYGLPFLFLWWWLRRHRPHSFVLSGSMAPLFPWLILVVGLQLGLARGGISSFSRVGSNGMAELLWLAAAALLLRGRLRWSAVSTGLVLTPFLLGTGTGTALGDYAGHGVVFFQMAGLGIWAGLRTSGISVSRIVPFLWLGAVLNLFRAEASLQDPFRCRPLAECQEWWRIPGAGQVGLDSDQKKLLDQLQLELDARGFRPGDPILAIGDMPGIVYLMGGWSPGTSWYFAATQQQWGYVRAVLSSIPEETRARSWVLIRENSPLNEQRPQILHLVGRQHSADFTLRPLRLDGEPTRIHGWRPVRP